MAETHSTMKPLGFELPPFTLPDVGSNRTVSSDGLVREKPVLVMFICNHCPYVMHILPELGRLDRDYSARGLQILAINSNDVTSYPDDHPTHMRSLAAREGWSFPYLYDESQSVARVFDAACTPDFFLFDGTHRLVYRGQLDDSRPRNRAPVNGKDLRQAIDAVLAGQVVSSVQRPSVGCNIKWAV